MDAITFMIKLMFLKHLILKDTMKTEETFK